MSITIEKIRPSRLNEYAEVPLICDVRSVFDVEEISGEIRLSERPVDRPYLKDYCVQFDSQPTHWPYRFAVSNWAFWLARDGEQTVGAAALAWNTPDVEMLEGRSDLAVLWDIRVRPTHHKQGVGSELFRTATDWARSKGCRHLKIETQNVNVPACRFYAKMGCRLRHFDRSAYRDNPHAVGEIMLIWYKDLLG